MKKLLFCCLTLLSFVVLVSSCTLSESSEDDIVFNARELIGQSPEGVIKILGSPDTTFHQTFVKRRYFIQYYDKYGIEVRYLQGSISGVIVNEPYPLKFAPETITKFGIDYTEPTKHDTRSSITWKNIEGFKAINFYLRGVEKSDSVEHSYRIYFNMDTTTRSRK